jgi:hypothetical protein
MRPTNQCPRVAPTSWRTSWARARLARGTSRTRPPDIHAGVDRKIEAERHKDVKRRQGAKHIGHHAGCLGRYVRFLGDLGPRLRELGQETPGPRVSLQTLLPLLQHAGHPLEKFVDLLAQRGAREPEAAAHERQQAQGHERQRPAVGEAGMSADKRTHLGEEDRQQHASKDEQHDRDAVPHQQQQQESRHHHSDGVLYLPDADKYCGLTRRSSQEQKGLDERTLMASQRPLHPW